MKSLQMNQQSGQACCAPPKNADALSPDSNTRIQAMKSLSGITKEKPPWVTGIINTPAGLVPVASTQWTRADRLGQIRSRISAFRENYSMRPGLYAVGAPDASSDIFVSANYKLSFDILRRALQGISGWILVLDTKGINVWCAAGKGTFGTDELVKRVLGLNLAALVSHRNLIVPQLGATGVQAAAVKKKTGFNVRFGPVEAEDIPVYVRAGHAATSAMREIRFGMVERMVLTPIELNQAIRRFPVAALIILVLFGLQPSGILFKSAWLEGWPFILLCLTSVLAGAFFTPVLLPFIPFRSFAVKGLLAGTAAVIPLVLLTPVGSGSIFLNASAITLFPLISSYLALQFTGATTFTTFSGVKKELKLWVPVYITGLAASVILLILYKIQSWGLI
ncbi:MAG TPA: mercury methylation corrinoid protein HgcA [Spirochaetota bacterium]|nr:acetyl-CoA synthase subunit gamma [Spirochaetota bacterium]HOD14848.1 mercury methylation corrinoid protein HgcA [Spirochaetota bacterium]HPN10664.1 mercury methylation corrinoid protein HgcA [Spirochaetota bacterium]HQL80876.1 mercury methylation corrinoid protein HgcA [Spirochaetota bacterium]